MLQLRTDSLKRLLIIGEEPKEEKIEYCDFGIIHSTAVKKTEQPKKQHREITKEEFEKMLRTV